MKIPLRQVLAGALLAGFSAAAPLPWWDNFPRMIMTSDLATAQAYSANAALNGVNVRGNTPLTYQWLFNETKLPGATNSMLVLSHAVRTNSGSYAVAVTNQYGDTLSSNATLTVQVPLELRSPLVSTEGAFQFIGANSDGFPVSADELTNYEALASTNLLGWTLLSNVLTWSNSILILRDVDATNYSSRFYRLR